jgi:hypothetical protein
MSLRPFSTSERKEADIPVDWATFPSESRRDWRSARNRAPSESGGVSGALSCAEDTRLRILDDLPC